VGVVVMVFITCLIARNFDTTYSSEKKIIEKIEDVCAIYDSKPHSYDWVGNVECEDGFKFQYR
jgi:hypothetical protein